MNWRWGIVVLRIVGLFALMLTSGLVTRWLGIWNAEGQIIGAAVYVILTEGLARPEETHP